MVIKDELYSAFIDYLSAKDIKIVTEYTNLHTLSELSQEEILNKLELASEFHKKTMGYKGYMGLRLDNKTGSIIEQYKVVLKRVKRYLKNIRMNGASSNFERKLLKLAPAYIQRAENCISDIMQSGYMDIIDRSMKRTEICIGNISFQNIDKVKGILILNNISKCSYNNIEMDCFYFLSRCKRRELKFDYKKLAQEYCKHEELDEKSLEFILTLLSYPYEFIRCCNNYRERVKDWTEEEYEERLDKAISKDGGILL